MLDGGWNGGQRHATATSRVDRMFIARTISLQNPGDQRQLLFNRRRLAEWIKYQTREMGLDFGTWAGLFGVDAPIHYNIYFQGNVSRRDLARQRFCRTMQCRRQLEEEKTFWEIR
jgi:hypothetical protein